MKITRKQLRWIIAESLLEVNEYKWHKADRKTMGQDGKAKGRQKKNWVGKNTNDVITSWYKDMGLAEALDLIKEAPAGKGWTLADRSCNTHNIPENEAYEAIAVLQEFGYQLNIPITVDSNNIAINDALAGYPGEYTYEDFKCAIQVIQGRGG